MGKHGGNQGGRKEAHGLMALAVGESKFIPWIAPGRNGRITMALFRARRAGRVLHSVPGSRGLWIIRKPDGSDKPGSGPAPGPEVVI